MDLHRETYAIVGSGVCGVAAAASLRQEGFDGEVLLIGDEAERPYQRPPLSKGFLASEVTQESLQVQLPDWYEENAVCHMGGRRVVEVAANRREIVFASGSPRKFDKLLLATGGSPRLLPGMAGNRVLTLRTLSDASRLACYLKPGAHVIVLGGGFIGSEVAATARKRGADVTIVEALPTLMMPSLGKQVGDLLGSIHAEAGVRLLTNQRAIEVVDRSGSVSVRTSAGVDLEGDVVLVCAGMQPNIAIVTPAAIEVDNGIVVDSRSRTTISQIFAAGDVANTYRPTFARHVRVEHHDNAVRQGASAARSMLDKADDFTDVPWGWSDQYDHNLQFTGCREIADSVVLRGSMAERRFSIFFSSRGRLCGAIGLNSGKEIAQARKFIAQAATIEDEMCLKSDDEPLKKAFLISAAEI
jgi:3-phenylpropionate/trans-cinnamate dioxygenase ferredoxin reductase subunit